jgi:hypothetical protein
MKLIAVSHILYRNKQYYPGDELPIGTDMQEVWIDCGSATFEDSDETVEKKVTKARRVMAQSGLTGTAVNSESDENLIGRVPVTEGRRRK